MSRSLKALVIILCAAMAAHSCNSIEYNPTNSSHRKYVMCYDHNDTLLHLSTMYPYDYWTGNTGVKTLIVNLTDRHIKSARAVCVGVCKDNEVVHSFNYEIIHPPVGGLGAWDSIVVTIPLYVNRDSITDIQYIIPEVEIEIE